MDNLLKIAEFYKNEGKKLKAINRDMISNRVFTDKFGNTIYWDFIFPDLVNSVEYNKFRSRSLLFTEAETFEECRKDAQEWLNDLWKWKDIGTGSYECVFLLYDTEDDKVILDISEIIHTLEEGE